MSTSRALRFITSALVLTFTLALGNASPAAARRRPGPTATPAPSTEGVLENQVRQAAQESGNELRACDSWLSRAASSPPQARFQVRVTNGQLQVNAAVNAGGTRYTSCLEQSLANAILRTTQRTGQTLPYNAALIVVDVVLPYAVAPQPQPGPTQPVYPPVTTLPPQYSAVFEEQGRFVVRNVRLEGQGPALTVANGGVVRGTLELQHNCPGCGPAINQVIVGLANEATAQQCVWNGGGYTRGFETVSFQLNIPNQPGTYEIRVRYAQASSCQQGALGWWRVGRPTGPDARSTIAVVTVAAPTPPPVVQPPPVVVVPPTQQQGNMLVNGGFEQPQLSPGAWQVLGALPGWQLSMGPGIEVQNNAAGRPAEGRQLVELDSQASSGIYQDVQTSPGQTYELRIAFSARPGTARVDNSVAVLLDGRVVHTLEAEGSQLADTQWTYQSIQFQATGSSTRIELRHVGRSSGLGGYVDDVSLTPLTGRGRYGSGRGRGPGRGPR